MVISPRPKYHQALSALIGICTLRFILNIPHVIPDHRLDSFLNKQFCAFLRSGKTWSPLPVPRWSPTPCFPIKYCLCPKGEAPAGGQGLPPQATATTLAGEKIPRPATVSSRAHADGHQNVPTALLGWVTARILRQCFLKATHAIGQNPCLFEEDQSFTWLRRYKSSKKYFLCPA